MSDIVLEIAAAAQGPAVPGEGAADFRGYLFAAYGAVLVLLFLFTAWTAHQVAAARRKVEGLERRLELQTAAGEAGEKPQASGR